MPRLHAPALLPAGGGGQGIGGAVFLGLFATLALLSCFKYLALHSTVSGLGLVLSDCYSIHYGAQWWRAFTEHARPLLPLFAQVYRLVPDQAAPFVLLTLQALALALPALWVARRHGLLASLACALFFPIWTIAVSDFHLEALLVPILFGFLASARAGRHGLAVALGLAPLLLGESQVLTTACCGLYLVVAHGRTRSAMLLLLVGCLWFFLARRWLIPFCTAEAVPPWPAWPGTARLAGLLASPQAWFNLTACFGALLFFPLFRPKLLLPALPALVLTFASGPDGAWTTPDTAGAAGVLLFAFCEVLGPVRELSRQSGIGVGRFGLAAVLSLALVHVLLAPSPVSRLFLTGDSFAFGMGAFAPTARDAAILAEILRSVPDDDAVPVTAQNSLNWGAVAERRHYASFPRGVFAPRPVRDLSVATWRDFVEFVRTGRHNAPIRFWLAQYVVLDATRPWCLLDRCCRLQPGPCLDEDLAREYDALVRRARQEMDAVYDQGGFLILKRRPEPAPAPPPAQPPAADPAATAPASQDTPQAPQPGTN
jgi:hypothetical protein